MYGIKNIPGSSYNFLSQIEGSESNKVSPRELEKTLNELNLKTNITKSDVLAFSGNLNQGKKPVKSLTLSKMLGCLAGGAIALLIAGVIFRNNPSFQPILKKGLQQLSELKEPAKELLKKVQTPVQTIIDKLKSKMPDLSATVTEAVKSKSETIAEALKNAAAKMPSSVQ